MSLNRHATQRDANEPEIVAALRAAGASVWPLDEPLDLLVGYRGRDYLLEVKLPLGPNGGESHSVPNDKQKRFMLTWRGQRPTVVRSIDDALAAVGCVERKY